MTTVMIKCIEQQNMSHMEVILLNVKEDETYWHSHTGATSKSFFFYTQISPVDVLK